MNCSPINARVIDGGAVAARPDPTRSWSGTAGTRPAVRWESADAPITRDWSGAMTRGHAWAAAGDAS